MTICLKRRWRNFEDDISSMSKPFGLKGLLESTCLASEGVGVSVAECVCVCWGGGAGVQVNHLPEQWVGVRVHMLTGSNFYRKNSLDFDNSGATSFVILLKHDFPPQMKATVREIFSLGRKPSNPPWPPYLIQPFISSTIYLWAYCVLNAVLGSWDAVCPSPPAGSTFMFSLSSSMCQNHLHNNS